MKHLLTILVVLLTATTASAETFLDYFTARTAATTVAPGTDSLILLQSGTVKKVVPRLLIPAISCNSGYHVSGYSQTAGTFTCSADTGSGGGGTVVGGITSLNGATNGTQTFVAGSNIAVTTDTGAGTHSISVIGIGTSAALNVPASGNATSVEVVKGSDTRLTDSRVPTAHNQAFSTITATPTTLSGYGITDAATSAQGALAASALQPNGNGSQLTGITPTQIGAATSAQGALAASALQPTGNGSQLIGITASQVSAVANPVVTYTRTPYSPTALTGTAKTIALSDGVVQKYTLSNNSGLTFTVPTVNGQAWRIEVVLVDDGLGSGGAPRTYSWAGVDIWMAADLGIQSGKRARYVIDSDGVSVYAVQVWRQ